MVNRNRRQPTPRQPHREPTSPRRIPQATAEPRQGATRGSLPTLAGPAALTGDSVILGQPYPFRGRAPRPARSELGTPAETNAPRPVLPAWVPRTRFPERPDWPDPQSQSLSRSYGSVLPTSLTYIILSTRGCSPWRPDAVISTDMR